MMKNRTFITKHYAWNMCEVYFRSHVVQPPIYVV